MPAIESVFNRILLSGIAEARGFNEVHETKNSPSFPLIWSWHGNYYLGAIRGVAPRELVLPHIGLFTSCISALCTLAVQNHGHLPSSLPAHQRLHSYV